MQPRFEPVSLNFSGIEVAEPLMILGDANESLGRVTQSQFMAVGLGFCSLKVAEPSNIFLFSLIG